MSVCGSGVSGKLPLPDAPFAEGGFPTASGRCRIDAPGFGVPDHVPNYESQEMAPALARDYPLVQGCILLIAVTYVTVNLVTDLLYGVVDPRIRYE